MFARYEARAGGTTRSRCSTNCSGPARPRCATARPRTSYGHEAIQRLPRLAPRAGLARELLRPSSPPTATTSRPPTASSAEKAIDRDRPPEPDLDAHRRRLARGRRAREPELRPAPEAPFLAPSSPPSRKHSHDEPNPIVAIPSRPLAAPRRGRHPRCAGALSLARRPSRSRSA